MLHLVESSSFRDAKYVRFRQCYRGFVCVTILLKQLFSPPLFFLYGLFYGLFHSRDEN